MSKKRDIVDADEASKMAISAKKYGYLATGSVPRLPADEVKRMLGEQSESEKATDVRKQPHLDWEPGKPCPCCGEAKVDRGTVPVFDVHEKVISCPGCGEVLQQEVWNCSKCSWHSDGEILMPGCSHANKKLKLKERK